MSGTLVYTDVTLSSFKILTCYRTSTQAIYIFNSSAIGGNISLLIGLRGKASGFQARVSPLQFQTLGIFCFQVAIYDWNNVNEINPINLTQSKTSITVSLLDSLCCRHSTCAFVGLCLWKERKRTKIIEINKIFGIRTYDLRFCGPLARSH